MSSIDILNKLSLREVQENNEFVSIDKELEAIDDEQSDEELAHKTLVNNISQLSSARKTPHKFKATRFEASDDVNQYNLSQSNDQIKVTELIASIKDPTGKIKKRLKNLHRKPLLDTPLEKPLSDQIGRRVAYETSVQQLTKWDSVVDTNRRADQLHFPLKQCDLRMEATRHLVKNFAPKTKMELEIAEVLSKSENVLTDNKPITVAEKKYLKAMSLEEVGMRIRDLQKTRALNSFQFAKQSRQKKIKSKIYHRILRKERLKKDTDLFEEQRQKDPEAALRQLNELDILRAKERVTLRHMNTGKCAKINKLKSKYDDPTRQAMSDQMEFRKKLLKKQPSDDEVEQVIRLNTEINDDNNKVDNKKDNNNEGFTYNFNATEEYNPWLRSSSKGIQIKLEEIKRKEMENQKISAEKKSPNNKWKVTERKDKKETPAQAISIVEPEVNRNDEPLITETTSGVHENLETNENDVNYATNVVQSILNDCEPEIDPNVFITVKTKNLKSSLPDVITNLDSDDDNSHKDNDNERDDQRQLVMEAFAEDDVINDFAKEKKDVIENETEKPVSLHLPGWGEWSGSGIIESKRKKRKFTIKAEKKRRKDHNMGNVIISERKDAVIAKYQVKELPFPYRNVKQYENSIRQPIGRTWNPESVVRMLTQPKIVTKMGAVIKPIDSDALLNNKVKRPLSFKYYEKRSNKTKTKDNSIK